MHRGCGQADDACTVSATKAEGEPAGCGVKTLEKEGSPCCAPLVVMGDGERHR